MTNVRRFRPLAWGGLIGPVIFITGWLGSGLAADNYSPIRQTISQLAREGASTRSFMTAAFLGFALMIGAHAIALRGNIDRATAIAACITALASVAVAVFALGGSLGDNFHYGAATVAYVSTTAGPLLAARAFRGKARGAAAVLGAVAATALVLSVAGPTSMTGLWQRVGLTLGDVWFAASGVWILRRKIS